MLRWKNEINENLIVNADKCLFQFFESVDELPFNIYQKINLKFDIKQFSATVFVHKSYSLGLLAMLYMVPLSIYKGYSDESCQIWI